MSYQPNFKDKRVIRRLRHAYGWTRGVMSTTKPTRWGRDAINKYLGHHTHKLGRYLRDVLLITTDNYYSKDAAVAKQYLLNQRGLDYLRLQMTSPDNRLTFAEFGSKNIDNNTYPTLYPCGTHLSSRAVFDQELVSAVIRREHSEELENLSFTYTDKSSRLWHPIQSVRREFKQQILAEHGLSYQYDILCCAPTLIMRRAHQLGMETWPCAIGRYIEQRDQIRQQLAKHVGISEVDMKIVINALFCGARVGNNKQFSIYRLLGTQKRVELLRSHPFIIELRSDIKDCWSYITPTLARKSIIDKNGKLRMLAVSSKQKWSVYFQLERQVLDAVQEFLISTDNPYFLEHDGWTTGAPVDTELIQEHIFKQTGLKITVS